MADKYVGRYNYEDIFGDGKDGYKPSYLRDITRVHFYNNDDENRKTFISEREDQYEGFFSENFQSQIEERSRNLGYDRERITREAVFEQANYNYTNKVLGNTGSVFNRLFSAFQTPDLFESSDQSAMFGREVLHEFTNYLKQPASIRENPATSIPLPARELDYKFEQSIQNSISTAHQSSRHINKDIADFQRRNASDPSFVDYWTDGGVTRGKRLLDNVGYINRPGILPAIGMIHDAGSELSINIYQLQNKPIIDYLTADLKSKAEEFREGKRTDKFNFNLQLAWNQDLAQNEDSIRILSPNIVAIRTFQALQEKYGEFININILTNTKRNHTKLLFSDTGAYISTQNQTGPVGKSLYQAGSNYETGRYVRNLSIDNGSDAEKAEGKIYQQIKQVHNRMFGLNGAAYEQKILSTGLPNVGAAVETYEVLKSSLAYLHQANNAGRQVRADFILDQVFLLQHDSLLFDKVAEGEMGPESKSMLDRLNARSEYGRKKDLYRSELQEPLLKALIEGTATVTTDPRNYRKNVQEPIFSSLMGNRDYIDSGYDLTKYLGVDPNSSMNAEQKIQHVMNTKGFTRDKAIQLLAIESGNIQPANVPREHVKAFTMYELNSSERGFDYNGRKITPLGDSTNSSNMGLHSTGEGDTVNNELGTYHLSPHVRASSDVFKANKMDMTYALSTEEEYVELVDHTRNILTMKDDLSARRVNGQLQYTNVNNRAEYERSTDRAKLTELFSQLYAMNKASGSMMTVGYDFDNYGPIAVKVEVNSQLNYKFTYGQGFISEVNKSLVIGNSEFINQSSSAINLGFNQTVVVGDRITLSPIQTTMSMISSIALESEQIKLIKAPLIEYRENYAPGLDGNNAFDTGLGKYLLNLSGYGDRLTNEVLHKGIVDETSVVIGALTNLQARMKNADPTLDKVRQLAGIDIKSNDRLQNIEYLSQLIQTFASAGTTTDRRAVLTGEGLQAGTPNIKSFMATLFHSPEYADLLYDFVNSQGDPLYRKSVNDYVKEVSTRVYDPYLNRTQVSTYSSTQAYRQRPVYGVNQRREGFAESINRASAETQANLTKLGAFALAASPFEHDATSDLGKGTSLLYMPITGTGGSREKSGLEYSGYHNYAALHPYFQHKKIGTVTALDIIQDAGVGSIITRKGIGDYNQAIAHLGLTVDADDLLGEGEDTKLLFNFDVRKKASQIPQRIKNVIGSRPTRELTEVYQNLVEGHAAIYKGLDGKSRLQVNSIDQLQQAYLTDLRNSVGDKKHLIDDSYSVGIEEGGQIRATLSSDLAEVLEKVREDVNNEFSEADASTRNEILRVRLVQADRSAHAMRGFIGSSKRQGDSVVLFQLSGAYSDYSILNPEFGGENGMRTTFSDRAVKGQKSSQISSQRLLGVDTDFNVANEILVNSGDYIKRNKETGLFHVYSFDGNTYVPGQVISSRKEASLLNNLIESVKVDPTFGNLNFTSNAASFEGVDAIEILKDIRLLEGGVESNEIRVELNYNRTQKAGGGGRQESLSGGLAKMVPIYLYNDKEGKGLLSQMLDQFNEQRAGSFADSKVDFHQFYGLVNPSNLKSYFYEHGAKILIDDSKRSALLNTDGQKLAASLLMAFGTSKFGKNNLADSTLLTLSETARSGKLGTFYRDQYLFNYIDSKGDEAKTSRGFIQGLPKDAVTGKDSISNLQVRTLEYVGLDLINLALTGDKPAGTQLQDRLKTLLTDHIGNVVRPGEYVDIGKDRGRELSILAASLDYFVQLTEAKSHDIAVLDATRDNVAYRSLGTIGGQTYDELQKEDLDNLVNQLGRRSYVVGMNMSMSGSQSKVAISSKLDSFIENQHLIWEPFYTDANKFKGGALGSLRQLMAGFFGAMTGTHSGEYSNAVTKLQQIDILSPHARGAVFKSAMLGVYNDPGVGDGKFKELQRNYEMFEALHSVADLDNNSDLVSKIVEVYRKKSDGQDIDPTQLNKQLISIVEAATSGNKVELNKLVDQGRYYAFNHFERMYADFRLDPAKRTNAGQAISSGLQRSAGSMGRFAFTFPHLEFTDDGVKVYKDVQQHSFSLAGEDMKIIGESYGAVDNPLQKSQLVVWQAFAPGSAVGRIFDRIAATTDKVFSINDLSEEDHTKLVEFYNTATLFPDELTEALGVFANKTVGGSKVGFGGGTTTPAAWFMGSTTATILPEAILARHGGGNTNRMRVHQGLVNQYDSRNSSLYSKEAVYKQEKETAYGYYESGLLELAAIREENIRLVGEQYAPNRDIEAEQKRLNEVAKPTALQGVKAAKNFIYTLVVGERIEGKSYRAWDDNKGILPRLISQLSQQRREIQEERNRYTSLYRESKAAGTPNEEYKRLRDFYRAYGDSMSEEVKRLDTSLQSLLHQGEFQPVDNYLNLNIDPFEITRIQQQIEDTYTPAQTNLAEVEEKIRLFEENLTQLSNRRHEANLAYVREYDESKAELKQARDEAISPYKLDYYQQKELHTFGLSAIQTINKGISGNATVELNALLEASREFDKRIKKAGNNKGTLTQIIQELEGVGKPESKQTIGYYRNELNVQGDRIKARLSEGGDSFVSLLGLYEMRMLRAEALQQGGFTGTHRGVAITNLLEQADTYKSLISPIDGLLVGSNNKDSIYVNPEELAGEMRRGSSKLENSLGLTYKNIAGLEGEAGAKYLNTIVDGVNQFAKTSIRKLQLAYNDSSSIKLAKGTINRLNEMRASINSYSDRINKNLSKHEVADLALLIQTDVERYHAEIMLSSDQANRPAPMGNPYSGRAIYDVFRLTDLNNLMSEYNLPISFTPVSGDNRNKTLHLFNPFSWLVAHGGDFDGDMITNMFRSTNQLSLKAKSYDALIENAEATIQSLNLQQKTATDERGQQLHEQMQQLAGRVKNYKEKQAELKGTIENITKHESVKEYQIAAAKWVGNYLKVDYNTFLGSEHGGYRRDGDSLPPEVLFTFTEQGRGLFGGMEGIVSKSKDLFNDITALANKKDRFNNYNSIDELLLNVTNGSGLESVIRDDGLRSGFLSDLTRAITQADGDIEAGAAIHTANLFAAQGGAEALQKYNLKGIDGASMTPAIFEAMEHTLGQAGSVILGKSYNTMVGMLYTEAPSLAMSYAVLNDPDGKLEKLIVDSQGQPAYDKLKAAAIASREKSEGMGSFLQSTQQILRDSIKPKDAIGYLDELDTALKAYQGADEEGRSLAYQSIVEKFGPGAGLKALIEMESLVLDGGILNSRGNTDNDISKRSQTLAKYELTSTKMSELESRLGYNSVSGGFDNLSQEVNKQIRDNNLTKEYVLAAYKTKQDMVSVVSDFAFDKGLNPTGSNGLSTGFSMLDAFTSSKSSLDSAGIDRLTNASEQYASRTGQDREAYLANLDVESQAFIGALTNRGLGKLEPSDGEKKFNDLWDGELTSRNKREYAAHTWMETNKQFGHTVGEFGEMFIRFGAFNQARREAYSSSEDVRETYSGLDDPLAIAQLMGMTNGKVDPSMVGNLFNSLANAARNQTGSQNPTMAEIYGSIGIGKGLNETDADTTMKSILLNSTDEVQAHLLGVARTMSIGQQTASIQDYVNSSQQNYKKTMSYEILKAHYESLGSKDDPKFTPEEAEILARQAMVQSYSVASTSSSPAYSRPSRPNKIGKVLGSLGTDSDVKAQGFLFPLLGLVGAALSTGDLTPEAFQMAAGTALQNLSYVRWSNLEKNFAGTAANVMAGTAFKMRLALQESEGDAGKALVAATSRELTMAATSTLVNTFAPKYIDRMLGGGETLDFDKYQSGRNLLTSTLSAVASTVIGMAINNTVVNRMVSPDASYVSKELAAINQQNLKAFNTNQEESEEGVTVEGVDGDLVYKQLHTWTNDDDYQLGMDVSESINFAFNTEPNTVYEFQLSDS